VTLTTHPRPQPGPGRPGEAGRRCTRARRRTRRWLPYRPLRPCQRRCRLPRLPRAALGAACYARMDSAAGLAHGRRCSHPGNACGERIAPRMG